jgi:hypothetical protein
MGSGILSYFKLASQPVIGCWRKEGKILLNQKKITSLFTEKAEGRAPGWSTPTFQDSWSCGVR